MKRRTERDMTEARQGHRENAIRRLERLAILFDAWVAIPGTKVRIGLDALLGLVPVAGDVLSLLVSLVVFREAVSLGVSKSTLIRMVVNFLIDALLGSVPVAGDVFDVFSRVNQRNLNLILREITREEKDITPQS